NLLRGAAESPEARVGTAAAAGLQEEQPGSALGELPLEVLDIAPVCFRRVELGIVPSLGIHVLLRAVKSDLALPVEKATVADEVNDVGHRLVLAGQAFGQHVPSRLVHRFEPIAR